MSRKPARRAARPSSSQGQIRIIGGQWRGRKLPVMQAEGLRPTTDRVKETLFNWLQFELPGARVLDLFAGSGSLGFEALSRGASHVVFAETSPTALRQLTSNINSLQASAEVISQGAQACLAKQPQASIDMVFIDPPFGKHWLDTIIPELDASGILQAQAWVYVESGQQDTFNSWPQHWHLHREKAAGQVTYRLFRVGG